MGLVDGDVDLVEMHALIGRFDGKRRHARLTSVGHVARIVVGTYSPNASKLVCRAGTKDR